MTKNIRLIAMLAAVALVLAAGVIAQQKSAETAIDPVCGMTVTKAKAAATFDYKGTTYYFCSTGCKDSFAKDPEKYLRAAQEKAAAQPGQMGQMGHMGQPGQMGMMKHEPRMGPGAGMGPGMWGWRMMGPRGMWRGGMGGRMGMPGPGLMPPGMGLLFWLYGDKIDVSVENTKDGAVLKFVAKDPEVAKAIQVHLAEHLAMMKKMMDARAKAQAAPAPQK